MITSTVQDILCLKHVQEMICHAPTPVCRSWDVFMNLNFTALSLSEIQEYEALHVWNARQCVWEIVSVQNMTISPCLAASHYPAGMIYDRKSLTLTTSSEQNLQRHHSQCTIFSTNTHTHVHRRTHTPLCCFGRYISTLDLKMTRLKCRLSALIWEHVHLYWVNCAGIMRLFHTVYVASLQGVQK